MVFNEATDLKYGSRSLTKAVVGKTLVWPDCEPYN